MASKDLFSVGGPNKPNLDKNTFDMSYVNNGTYKFGRVYPVYLQECPPNSTLTVRPNFGFDLQPFVFPIQTNIRCHMAFYKIPYRILMAHGKWQDFSTGVDDVQLPYIKRGAGWCETGSLADYLGLPTCVLGEQSVHGHLNGGLAGYTVAAPEHEIIDNSSNDLGHLFSASYTSKFNHVGFATQRICSHIDSPLRVVCIQNDPSYAGLSLFVTLVCRVSTRRSNGSVRSEYMYKTVELPFNTGSTAIAGKFVRSTNSTASINGSTYTRDTLSLKLTDEDAASFNACIDKYESYLLVHWLYSSSVFGSFVPYASLADLQHPSCDHPQILVKEGEEFTAHSLSAGFLGIQKAVDFEGKVSVNANATNNFSSIDSADPLIPVSALPFRAYEFLKNYVFRQERIDPFTKDGVEVYNEFLTNDGEGADSTTPVDFFNAPFEFDRYTTCVKNPQWGNAPLIGITSNDLTHEATLHMVPESGDPYDIGVSIGENSDALAISNYEDVADHTSVHRLQELIDAGISWNDVRNVSAFQVYLERYQRAGGYQYENYMKEFFGTDVPTGDHFPEYLGGLTRPVMVNKIQNSAKSEDAYLGEFAGTGSVRSEMLLALSASALNSAM